MPAGQLRRDLARLKEEAKLLSSQGKFASQAAKARADARQKRDRAMRASSGSSQRMYSREADRLEKKALDLEKKAAETAKKMASNSKRQASVMKSLDKSSNDELRRSEREERSRRAAERRHAHEIARLRGAINEIQVHRAVPPPKPEGLRILFLSANPDSDLRVDVEAKRVQDAVRRALHRDLVHIDYRPAATPEDLLDGLNELRPHVVHFSGHAGDGSVLFDDAEIERRGGASVGRLVTVGAVARTLGATDDPPIVLVLNACESLEGVDAALSFTPVVIGMRADISDVAATLFSTKFYAAIASAQSVGSALEQGRVAVEMMGLAESFTPDSLVRPDVDLYSLVLVRAQ